MMWSMDARNNGWIVRSNPFDDASHRAYRIGGSFLRIETPATLVYGFAAKASTDTETPRHQEREQEH